MKRIHVSIAAAMLALVLGSGASARTAPSASDGLSIKKLMAPAPSWFTGDVKARADAAGPAGVSLTPDMRATMPTSSLAFLGIRPGQLIVLDDGETTGLCTSNFVFYTGTAPPTGLVSAGSPATRSSTSGSASKSRVVRAAKKTGGSSSAYFIGTAGHCGKVGTDVYMLYLPKGLVHIGKIVKSTGDPGDNVAAVDFALVSVDPALNGDVSPSMAYWGGPTGVFRGSGVQPILHAGWGLVIGTGGTPRAGVAYAWNVGSEYRFEGAILFGDSGSGAVVAGGLAAGNITHIAVNTRQTPPVWNGGTTMTAILQYLGSSYTLATCSLPVPWPAPGCPPA